MPISPEISPYRAQLESGQWFRLLPGELQEQLLGEGRLLRLSAGQQLFRRGDPPCGLYAVLGGSMRVGAVMYYAKCVYCFDVLGQKEFQATYESINGLKRWGLNIYQPSHP